MKTSSMVSMGGFTLGERKMERYLVFGKRENERKQRKMQENKLGPNRQKRKAMKQGSKSDEGGKQKRNKGDRGRVKEGGFAEASPNLGRRGNRNRCFSPIRKVTEYTRISNTLNQTAD